MVNHIRTLLLNETQASLSEAGFPYGVPWVVSPSYDSVKVPAAVAPVRDALFLGTGLDWPRFDRIDAVMPVVSAADMSPFASVFDARSTVKTDSGSHSIRELFDASVRASNGFESGVMEAARGCPGLYAATGFRDIDGALSGLSPIARGSFEFGPRLAAVVLSYCMQLEAVNRRSNGG